VTVICLRHHHQRRQQVVERPETLFAFAITRAHLLADRDRATARHRHRPQQ
jgi:hypothetical protein